MGGGLNHENYDFNVQTIVGFRDQKPIYKIIKKFDGSTLNSSKYIPISEINNKKIISFSATFHSNYGCITMPYSNGTTNSSMIEYIHSNNSKGPGMQYINKGANWNGWILEVEIIYMD